MTGALRSARFPGALWPLVAALTILLASCAAPVEVKAPRYESAEHKNLVLLLRAYQDAWNEGNETAILRLYADKSREAPLLFLGGRTLGRQALAQNLPYILKTQAKAGLFQQTLSPIEYKTTGDTAQVAAYVKISYIEDAKKRTGYIRRTLFLRRVNYFWRIEFSHYEFVPADARLEGMPPL